MELRSPGVGKVLRLAVAVGAQVERGEEVMVIESMKVEIPIKAAIAGQVKEIHVQVGDQVQRNRVLAKIE
ncbi:MAG TPA: acetyl-CoA carboxylase biotin carboxyl carrier protein subunit [Candidatus Binataceae bacterium]|jgi:acetyl-CoA carboxylase biotin carboxyl carrier protein